MKLDAEASRPRQRASPSASMTPKGVAISHRSVLRLVRSAAGGAAHAELGPERTFLQFAPVAFDLSTLEIWGQLLNGGRVVLYPGDKASLEELGAAIHGMNWLPSTRFSRVAAGEVSVDGLQPRHDRREIRGRQ